MSCVLQDYMFLLSTGAQFMLHVEFILPNFKMGNSKKKKSTAVKIMCYMSKKYKYQKGNKRIKLPSKAP